MIYLQKVKLFIVLYENSEIRKHKLENYEANDADYERFKFLKKYWAGPNLDPAHGHCIWSTRCAVHVCFRNDIFIIPITFLYRYVYMYIVNCVLD